MSNLGKTPLVRRVLRAATALLVLLPPSVLAAGSSSYPWHIKTLYELIVQGDRPEISACLYAAQLAVSGGHEFGRLRWSERISEESVVREYRLASDWVRVTQFEASALTHGEGFFAAQRWVDVLVECQQVNEKQPLATLRLKLDKAAR